MEDADVIVTVDAAAAVTATAAAEMGTEMGTEMAMETATAMATAAAETAGIPAREYGTEPTAGASITDTGPVITTRPSEDELRGQKRLLPAAAAIAAAISRCVQKYQAKDRRGTFLLTYKKNPECFLGIFL